MQFFPTEWYIEVSIENWPECNLNSRPLNTVEALKPTELSGHGLNLQSEPTFYSYFSSGLKFHFNHRYRQSQHLLWSKFCTGNHVSETEGFYTYAIHHWTIFWRSYRKKVRVGFKPTATIFRWYALADWASGHGINLHSVEIFRDTPISSFVQCSDFIWAIALVSRHIHFDRNLAQLITSV